MKTRAVYYDGSVGRLAVSFDEHLHSCISDDNWMLVDVIRHKSPDSEVFDVLDKLALAFVEPEEFMNGRKIVPGKKTDDMIDIIMSSKAGDIIELIFACSHFDFDGADVSCQECLASGRIYDIEGGYDYEYLGQEAINKYSHILVCGMKAVPEIDLSDLVSIVSSRM